jgi:ATP-binding cassette subfamily F protein uup
MPPQPDPPLLLLQDIVLAFGTTPLLDGATLSVGARDRICLVGRNGSGKSTLLKIAAGQLTPDRGTRFLQPGTTVRYLPQEPDLTGFATTLAFVEAGLGPGDDSYRARYLLESLGLDGTEDPARLSGGEARRCALARTLAPSPDILLLDEPTNHLDLPAIAWLEQELAGMRSTGVVVISHDRRLLESLSQSMVWLDRGTTRTRDQGFAQFETWRDDVLAQEERDRHKLGRKIAMEEDWLRYGVTARRKRNQGRLAALQGLRKQRREFLGPTGRAKLEAADTRISGRLVIVAEDISKQFEGRPVVSGLSTRILRDDRVGIVGRNGAGKTTLLRMLTGALPPDTGAVRLGAGLEQVTLDQRRDSLDPARTLADTLTGGAGDTVEVNGERRHVMSYMKDFLFAPEQARTPVGMLSGGERGRLTLACALAKPSNLLVLDEPTNDLDLETLELLQELLADYPGTVLLVSHDRDFLDRVATSLIAAEGDGDWVEYAGGYSDMLAQRAPEPVATTQAGVRQAAARPTREKAGGARFSFKDRHKLQTLPARIEDLAGQRLALTEKLADPALYARDPAGFRRLSERLAETERLAAEAEEEWLALEMKREELEG